MKNLIILIFAIFGLGSTVFGQNDHVKISGTSTTFSDGDDVTLTVYKYAALGDWPEFRKEYPVKLKNHAFNFEVPCPDSIAYINLELRGDKRGIAYNFFIVTPGDQVFITEKDHKLSFTGTAAAAFKIHYDIMNDENTGEIGIDREYPPSAIVSNFTKLDSATTRLVQILESQKEGLPPKVYRLLKLDALTVNEWLKPYYLNFFGAGYRDSLNNPYAKAYLDYKAGLGTKKHNIITDSASAFRSLFFSELVYEKYIVDSCVVPNKKFSVHSCYLFVSSHYSGPLREQLLTYLFFKKRHTAEDFSADIKDALIYMKIADFRKQVEDILETDSVGATAFNFSLTDANNKLVRLADFRGKVVVLDFWFTGCGACRLFAPRLFQLEKQFEKQNVVFISINADKSRDMWLQSLKGRLYASPLSVNLNTGALGFKDPVIHHFDVQGYPTVMLIDKNGKIAESPGFPGLDNAKRLENLINKYLDK